jgi:hypothetical protein
MKMKLFCWIIGKSSSPFTVDLGKDDTVYDLKEAVMMKKPITLAGLEADQLTVWKVSDFFQHRLFDALVTPYKVMKDLENEVRFLRTSPPKNKQKNLRGLTSHRQQQES